MTRRPTPKCLEKLTDTLSINNPPPRRLEEPTDVPQIRRQSFSTSGGGHP